MYFKKTYLINLSLFICSFIITIFLLEITLNFFKLKLPENNKLTKLEYIRIKEKSSNNVVSSIPPDEIIEKYFPLSGIKNSLNINCNENNYWSSYPSDRFGFNNDDKIWNNNKLDYVFIGDSFTLGSCVNHDENFIYQFDQLNNSLSLNLGMMGTGPLKQLGILNEYGLIIPSKKIFWVFFEGNDLRELEEELDVNILNNYLNTEFTQGLSNHSEIINELLLKKYKKAINEEISNKNNIYKEKKIKLNFKIILKLTEIRLLIEKFVQIQLIKRNNYYETNKEKYNKVLRVFLHFVSINNTELNIIFIPSRERLLNENIFSNRIIDKKDFFLMLDNYKIKIIDTEKAFSKYTTNERQKFYNGDSVHFNKLGYKLIAEYLYNIN